MIKSNLFLVIAHIFFFLACSPLIAKESGSHKSKHKKNDHHSHERCCKEIKKYLQQYIKYEISKVTCLLHEIKKCCKKEKENVCSSARPSNYDRYGHYSWRDSHKPCSSSCGSH